MKRLGPELKMPEAKVPPFLSDLYWDLRDRHLLPFTALVVIAIAAVPILLAGGSEETSEPPVRVATPNPGAARSDAASLTVVEAKPGLRDYHKRLAGRKPTDPFEQRFTAPQIEGAKLGGGDSSTTTKTTTTESSKGTKTTTETTTETNDGSSGGAAPKGDLRLYTFSADIQVTRIETKASGKKEKSKQVRHGVLPSTPLPNEKTQLVAYMGIGPETQNPLFLVSDAVTGVFGESTCLSGSSTCQLLEVETGFPITLVFGSGKVRYKFNVLKIKPVTTGKFEPGGK